jgi:hypothetical protein
MKKTLIFSIALSLLGGCGGGGSDDGSKTASISSALHQYSSIPVISSRSSTDSNIEISSSTSVSIISSLANSSSLSESFASSLAASSVQHAFSSDYSTSSSLSSNSVIETDTTPPIITLLGNAEIRLNVGDSYLDAGATAYDNVDGELTVTVTGLVNTNKLGTYTQTYTATDISGNSGSATRVITVIDEQVPVVTLQGEAEITLYVGDLYLDAGATAYDNVDGELTVTVTGLVDTNKLGTYTQTYTAADTSGNIGSATRVVNVVDGQAPNVTLQGEAEITLYVGDSYLDAGATAYDNVDGELTVTVTGLVDTNHVGTYTLTYIATDNTGNIGTASRAITVRDLDYSFKFSDPDLTLWESSYQHSFELTFDRTETKDRYLSVSVSNLSTATEGDDFDLKSNTIFVAANSKIAYVTLEIYDDEHFENTETIVLAIESDLLYREVEITLSDVTSLGKPHASLSNNYFIPPTTVVNGDKLIAVSPNNYEIYNLLTESITLSSRFSPGMASGFGDAISFKGDTYVFASGNLYKLNIERSLSSTSIPPFVLVSTSPWFVEWTSEIQILNDELYVIGGRTDYEAATTQVLVYNFSTNEWRQGPALNQKRYGAASAVVEGKIYIFRGNYGRGTTEIFDPVANYWTYSSNSTSSSLFFDTATASGRYIDVILSLSNSHAQLLRFDSTTEVWQSYELTVPSASYQDSFPYKGRVYVVGGMSSAGYGNGNSITSFYIGDDAELFMKQ